MIEAMNADAERALYLSDRAAWRDYAKAHFAALIIKASNAEASSRWAHLSAAARRDAEAATFRRTVWDKLGGADRARLRSLRARAHDAAPVAIMHLTRVAAHAEGIL